VLLLQLRAGSDTFVLDTKNVVEIIPMVKWTAVPGAPRGIAGIVNYHGDPLPLIDLSDLVSGTPAEPRMTTRVVVARYGSNGSRRSLALLAEGVTDVIRIPDNALGAAPLQTGAAPYLGRISTSTGEVVQEIDVSRLLPEELRAVWFA
jgi:chemotaxis-related protein WspB